MFVIIGTWIIGTTSPTTQAQLWTAMLKKIRNINSDLRDSLYKARVQLNWVYNSLLLIQKTSQSSWIHGVGILPINNYFKLNYDMMGLRMKFLLKIIKNIAKHWQQLSYSSKQTTTLIFTCTFIVFKIQGINSVKLKKPFYA